MNYLHPEEPERQDTIEEHIFCNRIFVRALSFLLKEQEGKSKGVVVQVNEGKFLVHTEKNQIKISVFEDNLPEGTFVWFHHEDPEGIKKSDQFIEFCTAQNLDPETPQSMDQFLHKKWLREAKERVESEDVIQKTMDELKLSLEIKYGKPEEKV